jgi:hypothetical protein
MGFCRGSCSDSWLAVLNREYSRAAAAFMQLEHQIMGMSQAPARFTQAEVHRAIKAVRQSGADMVVEITADGTIRIAPNLAVSNRVPAAVQNSRNIML